MKTKRKLIDNNNSTSNNYSNSKKRNISYYLSECICNYSSRYKLNVTKTAELFNEYNLFKYIYDCYDYLHLGNINNTIKDLNSRIKGNIYYKG